MKLLLTTVLKLLTATDDHCIHEQAVTEAAVNYINEELITLIRCTKARKATHGLDGQHQDVDRTLRGRVNQNDRGQG